MEEFAGRADMGAEEFVAQLEQAGVSEQTFREFVRAGITWREFTRARFAPRVSVSDADLERATQALTGGSAVRVLLSEIILPIRNAEEAAGAAGARAAHRRGRERGAFRRLRPRAFRGRQRPERRAHELDGGLGPARRGCARSCWRWPRARCPTRCPSRARWRSSTCATSRRHPSRRPEYAAIEYARYYIPGGRSEDALRRAAQVRAEVDTCDDLYGIAKGQPPEVLERPRRPPRRSPPISPPSWRGSIPAKARRRITRNDGEVLVFLMLCGRSPKLDGEQPTVEDLSNFIRNQRIQSFADGYLEQLRAEARIVEP